MADRTDADLLKSIDLWFRRTSEAVSGETAPGHYLHEFFERCEPRAIREAIAELRSRHG